ncbi:MAG: hypothetical protein WC747_02280 [Candidatus Babeliales bacterium]|jgi:hypothetical protein
MRKLLFLSFCFLSLNVCGSQVSSGSDYAFTAELNDTQNHFRMLQKDCLNRKSIINSGSLTEDSLQRHLVTLGKKETELVYLRNKEIINQGSASQELQELFDKQRAAVKSIRELKKLLADPGLLSDERDKLENTKTEAYDQALCWGMMFYIQHESK